MFPTGMLRKDAVVEDGLLSVSAHGSLQSLKNELPWQTLEKTEGCELQAVTTIYLTVVLEMCYVRWRCSELILLQKSIFKLFLLIWVIQEV